jgi:hypothetical protein
MKAAINMQYRRQLHYEPLEDRRLLATVTVTTLADTIDLNDGLTSLREAIFATNLVAGADAIQFAPSLTASGPATILLSLGELAISDDLAISGPAIGSLTIDASASDPTPDQNNGDGSRVFHVDDGNDGSLITVSIEGVTLKGGDALNRGGAVLNRENLAVVGSRVTDSNVISGDIAELSVGGGIAHSVGQLAVTSCVIDGNAAEFGGGIHIESGSLMVDRTIIAANSSASGSGIYIAAGNAEVTRSSIHGNTAGAFSLGGGIYNAGNLRVEATTISGNTASFGAGVFSRTDTAAGEATRIINSTISGNTAFDRGGGVRNAAGLTTIEHSTITGNQAPPGDGSGVASRGYANTRTEVRSSIIAGNKSNDVDFVTGDINTFQSLGFNIIGTGNATAAFDAAGDRTGIVSPLLGPLGDNGGPTLPDGSGLMTHALLPGSPAINAGDLNAEAGIGGVPLYDQRGESFPRIVNGRIDIGAYEFEEPSDLNLVVDTLADESDGDFRIGDLSLREAIQLANLWPSSDTIHFDRALTAGGPATILLKMGELKVTGITTIEGPGAKLLTIDASGNDPTPDVDDGKGSRVLNLSGSEGGKAIDVSLANLTLTGGDFRGSAESGGAIFSRANLTITASTIRGNATRFGGGIDQQGGSLTIANSAFSANSALMGGGAIWSSADVTITGSTINNNSAGGAGGGIFAQNVVDVAVADSSISGNSAVQGGGIWMYRGSLTVSDSTIMGNMATGLMDKGQGQPGHGGGIYTRAFTTITRTTLTGNSANGDGGGIYSDIGARGPVLTVTQSTLSSNTAGRDGGGLFASSGPISILESTFNNNTAGRNGGGIAQFAMTTLTNTTISGNRAVALGGGIWSAAGASIAHSTVFGNRADSAGGGAFITQNPLVVSHAIVAFNSAPAGGDLAALIGATVTPKFSLIGNGATAGLSPAPPSSPDANGNIIGGGGTPTINPQLLPLANNGGPTRTHAPRPGSPAVNAGDPTAQAGVNNVPLFDQRGATFARIVNGRIDIGAFELLAGDYNANGAVDAVDYVLWRETRGSTTDLRADGNADGFIDVADLLVWRANFGKTAAGEGQSAASEEVPVAIAAMLPPLPAGPANPVTSPHVDDTATPLRRRAVGPRLHAPIALNREVTTDELLLNLRLLQRTARDDGRDFSALPRNATRAAPHKLQLTWSAVDRVFETIGSL